jgi:hypothetical protein
MWCNNHDHNTHVAWQLQPQHHVQCDDSNCNTKCSIMMATATPTWHNNSAHNTMHGTMTATTTPNAA